MAEWEIHIMDVELTYLQRLYDAFVNIDQNLWILLNPCQEELKSKQGVPNKVTSIFVALTSRAKSFIFNKKETYQEIINL